MNASNSLSQTIRATDGDMIVTLHRFKLAQLKHIDNLLAQVGEFGELRLIVEKGSIRFAEIVVSKRL